MFDDLQKRLSSAFKRFRVSGVLTEANMKEGLREVRTALLEADVHFDVVQEFMARINAEAVGTQLIKSVRPEQQIVKIVHDELIDLMGPVDPSIRFEKAGTTVLMLCGLQGAGKTTTCGKLAKLLQSQGPQADARRGRPSAPGGHRTAQGHRHPDRRSGVSARPIPTRSPCVSRRWSRPTGRAVIP